MEKPDMDTNIKRFLADISQKYNRTDVVTGERAY